MKHYSICTWLYREGMVEQGTEPRTTVQPGLQPQEDTISSLNTPVLFNRCILLLRIWRAMQCVGGSYQPAYNQKGCQLGCTYKLDKEHQWVCICKRGTYGCVRVSWGCTYGLGGLCGMSSEFFSLFL